MKYIDVVQKFESLEKKNISDLQINGVYLWEVIRIKLFNTIITELGILDKPHITVPVKYKNKIKSFFYTLYNSLLKSLPNKNYDTIIINHPRKILENNKRIDIYTSELIKSLKKAKRNYVVLDVSLNWSKHWYKISNTLYYYESIVFIKKILAKKFYKFCINKKKFNNFLNLIYQEFPNLKNSIEKTVFSEYFIFIFYEKYYLKKLKKVSPKEIYFVIGYVHFPMASAAKKLSIRCTEIQHGIISKIDQYYNYTNIKSRYFPERILGFSKFWYNKSLAVSKNNFLVHENNHIKKSLQKYSYYKKKKNQCIIIAQGSTTKDLIQLLKNNLLFIQNYSLIFKLHPSNYSNWENLYPDLVKLQNSNLLTVISTYKKSLHRLLAESEYQIGVFSTAIFEGLHLGCKTIILKTNGFEEIKTILNNEKCLFTNINDDLTYNIDNFKFDIKYYFKKIF